LFVCLFVCLFVVCSLEVMVRVEGLEFRV